MARREVGSPASGSKESPSRKRLGEVLASLRRSVGLTQQELADALGSDRFQIGRYERGIRVPDAVALLRILNALGSDLREFEATLRGNQKRGSRELDDFVRELRELR
jgi:transcriptional regulator with XRE-family HTH domain